MLSKLTRNKFRISCLLKEIDHGREGRIDIDIIVFIHRDYESLDEAFI